MDHETLPRVTMPNSQVFVLEARSDTPEQAFMSNCRQGRTVGVTMDSRQFVHPGSESETSQPR